MFIFSLLHRGAAVFLRWRGCPAARFYPHCENAIYLCIIKPPIKGADKCIKANTALYDLYNAVSFIQ